MRNLINSRALTLLAPAFLLLAVMVLVPLVILFVYSLGSRDELGRVVLGLSGDNYLRFFSGPYLQSLGRSLVLSTLTTASCLVIGYVLVLWIVFSAKAKMRSLLVLLVVLPLWTSSLLRIYAWITILRPTGILSNLLHNLSPDAVLPPLLYTPFAVWLGMVYNYLPYMVLPLYTSVERLDVKLLEASFDLGVSPIKSVFKVLIPLTGGGIIAGAVMVFVPSLGDYVTPDLLGGAKTMFIGNLIQNQFLTVRDWAFGSAASTLLIILVSFAVYIYLRYASKEAVG
ncbi:MAG: ABC transporter permease [Candidatus Obscuribacter sp.]|nr:ABC transporter permease [Candidatus Obscuribacter sp.]